MHHRRCVDRKDCDRGSSPCRMNEISWLIPSRCSPTCLHNLPTGDSSSGLISGAHHTYDEKGPARVAIRGRLITESHMSCPSSLVEAEPL